MKITDILQETYFSLLANKTRSGLTILGIVIGIASVIAMISIGQGASREITASIEGLGSNVLSVMPGVAQPGRGFVSSGQGSAQTLDNDDAEAIKNIPGVSIVSPELQRRFQIVSDLGYNTNSTVIGVTGDYQSVRNLEIDHGYFFSEQQNRGASRVVVLGTTTANDLFGEGVDSVGKTIRINNINFKVIGLLKEKGSVGLFNQDDVVLVPLVTMQKVLAGVDYLSIIAIHVVSKEQLVSVQDQATALLMKRHRVTEPDFSIFSYSDILGTLNQIINTFTIFLAAVAGISLLVGGIGIMNMMLTTVTERTREIGLRKAVGATSKDITLQFLFEAILLTLLGGVIGIALGIAIAFAIAQLANISTNVSFGAIALAVGVSSAIGIIFGYYPAKRASLLNPIDALRYE